jgi:raffinose/stachyose/melibiose transport system permease protein
VLEKGLITVKQSSMILSPEIKQRWKTKWIYIVLILYSTINLAPILWMMMNSFKTEKAFNLNPLALPLQWEMSNYQQAWEQANMGTYFANSIGVSGISVVVTVLVGALASYFLSRFSFKGGKWLYSFFVFGMLIPIHATLVPLFILMGKIGLLDSRFVLVFPYVAFNLPLTVFLLVSFMKAIPKEVEESAIMDGAGMFRIFWSVILPMSRPALATVSILNFIHCWNEFAFALVLVNNTDYKTIPLGLANFAGQFTSNYVVQMAGLSIVLVFTLIIYLLMEKHLVKGMTAGAVKG